MGGDPSASASGPDRGSVQVRGLWEKLGDHEIKFVDQLLMSFRGDYFILSLGQVIDPQPFSTGDDALTEIRERGTVPITPLVRVAIPQAKMIEFLNAAQQLVANLESTPESEENSND